MGEEKFAQTALVKAVQGAIAVQYTSPNAPEVRDVLGTWLLSILEGQRRYAHINGLRGDAVAPKILGMSRIISD